MEFRRSRVFQPRNGLGQVPLVLGPSSWMGPAASPVECPPGKVPINVGGRITCAEPGEYPLSAEYGAMRPIGAFGGFGMAPSAPIGSAGMGPSNVPVTMGNRAMLGQVRMAGRPAPPRSRALGQALRCWATEDGGTVCSDGLYHLPGCPHAPPVTEAEIRPTPPGAAVAHATGKSPVPA